MVAAGIHALDAGRPTLDAAPILLGLAEVQPFALKHFTDEEVVSQIDAALERLGKRIWVGVFGVACFLLAQMAEAVRRG